MLVDMYVIFLTFARNLFLVGKYLFISNVQTL